MKLMLRAGFLLHISRLRSALFTFLPRWLLPVLQQRSTKQTLTDSPPLTSQHLCLTNNTKTTTTGNSTILKTHYYIYSMSLLCMFSQCGFSLKKKKIKGTLHPQYYHLYINYSPLVTLNKLRTLFFPNASTVNRESKKGEYFLWIEVYGVRNLQQQNYVKTCLHKHSHNSQVSLI